MEGNKKWIMIIINAALVALCLALVIVGQRNIAMSGSCHCRPEKN